MLQDSAWSLLRKHRCVEARKDCGGHVGGEHLHTHRLIHTLLHTYACTHTGPNTHTHTLTHIHVHTHRVMHTHTLLHTNTCTHMRLRQHVVVPSLPANSSPPPPSESCVWKELSSHRTQCPPWSQNASIPESPYFLRGTLRLRQPCE